MSNTQRVCDFLKKTQVYFLATVEGDQPRVRPFGTAHVFEDKLYIQTGKSKSIAKQIEANGNVEICAFDGEQWVRVSGFMVADDRVEAKKSMLDAYPDLRSMYDENDDNTIVYYFRQATATFASFTSAPEVIAL